MGGLGVIACPEEEYTFFFSSSFGYFELNMFINLVFKGYRFFVNVIYIQVVKMSKFINVKYIFIFN